jgi:beta-glucanase (GH16 family)
MALLTVCLLAAAATTLPTPPAGKEWRMVWNEEFEGNRLDESKWDVPEYKRRAAYWSRKAIEVKDGHLAIKTFKIGDDYYNACVRTRGKYEKAFGYFEAGIKLQKSAGHWSAFWLRGDRVNNVDGDGRDGTEIDVMERPFTDDRINHALHWDGYGKEHQSTGFESKVPGIGEGWHTFGLWWSPTEYRFYIDGKPTWQSKAGGVCQNPLYMKLSDEAELGGWAGDVSKATLPDEFLTDYVRVYDLFDKPGG